MFTWNVATTWWIIYASVPGALAAFFANSFLMCLPWLMYRICKRRLGENKGYIALIILWMCFEYLHLQDWGLSWPWLTLGNVFATHPAWIQWYEFTGTSGGTLWVLVVNIILFIVISDRKKFADRRIIKYLSLAILFIFIPIILSSIVNRQTANHDQRISPGIVVVQPNIDPYEKIAAGNFDKQLEQLIQLSQQAIDDNTALVVWPETAIFTSSGIDEDRMKEDSSLIILWKFLAKYPGITLFSGIESYKVYDSVKTKTAKEFTGTKGLYYDAFNSSVLMNSKGAIQFYHKSMLVPGVETLPWFLRFIDRWFEKFGGTTAGYAKQIERTVLQDPQNEYRIAPSICYESIYGEFMAEYIDNGANVIVIITNDGWWDDTPGYKQHLSYARLRAIETRRWIARSANTGISAFIDPFGKVFEKQLWDTKAAISRPIPIREEKTSFVRNGDILSRVATIATIAILLFNFLFWLNKKFRQKKIQPASNGKKYH